MAGWFYPDRAALLEAELDRLMAPAEPRRAPRAVIVPHAGWAYSGRVAGAVYGRLQLPSLAIILGPNHTGQGPPGSVMARGRWALPGGDLAIDEPLAEALLAGSPALRPDVAAHAEEHAIEVQLPFLRRLRPDLRFVPVTLGRVDLAFCEEVGGAVARAVAAAGEPVLLVCSTDLNHYESQPISNRKDRLAIEAILSLDPARLHATVRDHAISMCGIAPTLATLFALGSGGGARAELVRYETSGDVSGDMDRVVGYAGVIIDS